MTPAEQATANAISFECKKDALQQRQSGDWKISFTVQGVEMDERITRAPMGTRFVAVLVAINDDETPVLQPAKENKIDRRLAAAPAPVDPKPAGARDWRDVPPAAQSGIRCGEAAFRAFLHEVKGYMAEDKNQAELAVRAHCCVHSRVEFGTNHHKRVLWHQLDTEYQAWLAKERVGA